MTFKQLIYFVDIDQTICGPPPEPGRYDLCEPYPDNISKINAIYWDGHRIVYWTARGSVKVREQEWFETTREQLNKWRCLYHELRLGKPLYDYIIDDKALRIEEL